MSRLTLMIAFLGFLNAERSQAATAYVIQAIGTPNRTALSAAINNYGQATVTIAPDQSPDGEGQVIFVRGETETSLVFMNGHSPSAAAMNDFGLIVGSTTISGGDSRAFRFNGSSAIDLGSFGAQGSIAAGVNNRGDIVGQRYSADSAEGFVIYSGGATQFLPTLGGTESFATDINEGRQIVGWSKVDGGPAYVAFLYDGTNMVRLGEVGGGNSVAASINNLGTVVGEAAVATGVHHATLFVLGFPPVDLAPAWYASGANDINDLGQIVGSVVASENDLPQAAIFGQTTPPVLLQDLLSSDAGWTRLLVATAINESGQIVGVGIRSGENRIRAFLMTPVPEPATMAGACWVTAILCAQLRRRRPVIAS